MFTFSGLFEEMLMRKYELKKESSMKLPEELEKLRDELADNHSQLGGTNRHSFWAGFNACYQHMAKREEALIEAMVLKIEQALKQMRSELK